MKTKVYIGGGNVIYLMMVGRAICNSYTMPTRAVCDLLPEPEGEGNKSHAARGGVV